MRLFILLAFLGSTLGCALLVLSLLNQFRAGFPLEARQSTNTAVESPEEPSDALLPLGIDTETLRPQASGIQPGKWYTDE